MKKYTIGTIGKIAGHPWFIRMEQGVKQFARDTGHNAFMRCPPQNKQEEATLNDVLAQGVDAVCIVTFFPQTLELTLSKARQRGVVVITHEAPQQRNSDYDIEAFDNLAYGAHLMDYLAQYVGQQGKYAIFLESLMTQSHNKWAEGALARQQASYPNMRFVSKKMEHFEDQTVAYQLIQELFQTHPQIAGILALGSASVIGAAKVIDEKNLRGQVKIVGNCLASMGGQSVRNGSVQLISFWDPAHIGYAMNKLAVMALAGDKITDGMDWGLPGYHQIKLDGKVLYGSAWIDVTKENMASYNF